MALLGVADLVGESLYGQMAIGGSWVQPSTWGMNKIRLQDSDIVYNDTVLGPASGLLANPHELVKQGVAQGVLHVSLPEEIDIVFTANGFVVGVESKKPNDLLSSFLSRRLARQIRTLIELTDIPCLLLRGLDSTWPLEVGLELARYQLLGVIVLVGPIRDYDVVKWLGNYRKVLTGTRNVLQSIKFTDEDFRPRDRKAGWYLKGIDGIGDKTAAKLHTVFGSTRAALLATDNEWKACGTNVRAVQGREEALR